MPDLIAIAYDEETIAGQAAEELGRRADDLRIDPDAIGVIVCERDGSCQLTTSRHPGATAAWSKFWGVLLGALMGDARMSGIDSAFQNRIKNMVTPGTSILFFVVDKAPPERATEALSQYRGSGLKSSIANDGIAELRDALDANTP
jgi:uncharacterized membrane protein